MIKLNEIFVSIQGEGFWTGTISNFIRFAGCNLNCDFCDTNHQIARQVDIDDILEELDPNVKHVVVTGGEPLVQLQSFTALCRALRKEGYFVAVETNGTIPFGKGIVDWVTMSPKDRMPRQRWGDELKLLWRGDDEADFFLRVFGKDFNYFYLQPIDYDIPLILIEDQDQTQEVQVDRILSYMQEHPRWRLSAQVHKLIGVR